METLISGIPNFKLKERIRDDDFVDQLHHFVTVYLLAAFAVIMALKEFASSPLDCWFTNQTWKHYQDHANFYCWSHKLYRYPNPNNLAECMSITLMALPTYLLNWEHHHIVTGFDDDVYKDLKASLLRTGKGRPKALKDMHINNKLLVQLAYLKEEGGTHWKAVDKWMEQLAPDVSHDCVTSTHFFNMVDSARNTFLKLFPDRHEDFLAQRVDLDFISSILSSFGITKTNIGTIPKEPVLPQDLPNQFVLDLEQFRTSQNLPKKLTFSWINFFTGFDMSVVPYELSPEHGGPKNQTILDTEDLGEINFYRWITVIFLCQAFMFKLPNLVWNECNEYSGTQIEKMVSMIGDTSFDGKEKKDTTFAGVAEYVEIWLKINRKPFWFMKSRVGRQTKKILSHCMLCVGANTGNYLSTMYLVVKALFLINILVQFLILTAFLEFNFWRYGARALMIYKDYDEKMDNIHFPRVALCHFQVKGQGSWIQCLLTINMILEKMFVMEWFWLFLLLILTIYSLFAWIIKILRTDYSVKFVTKYLSVFNEDGSLPQEGKRTVHTFVRDYLGNDGIFMLRILAVNTNDVVMAELVSNMWKRYTEYHYRAVKPEPVKEPEPSIDMTLDELEMEPLNDDDFERRDDSVRSSDRTMDGKTVDGIAENEKPKDVVPDVYHIA